MSTKSTVICLRSSSGGASSCKAAPQKPQWRKRSGFSSPQLGQTAIVQSRAVADALKAGPPVRTASVRSGY